MQCIILWIKYNIFIKFVRKKLLNSTQHYKLNNTKKMTTDNCQIFEMADDIDSWIEIAQKCKYLPENILKKLCDIVSDILLEESNVQPVSTPVTVCGDIHGQVRSNKNHPKQKKANALLLSSFTTLKSFFAPEGKSPTRITCFWAISWTGAITAWRHLQDC